MGNGCFRCTCILIFNFVIPLDLKITSKVCTPKFESHKIYDVSITDYGKDT